MPITDKEGKRYQITGTGLPIEEAFGPIAAPGVGFFDRSKRLISRQLSRTIPAIKAPIELGTGQNLYFDRPIDDYANWAVQQTPVSRALGVAKQMANPKESTLSKVSGFTTGLRFREYDPEKNKYWSTRNTAQKLLRQNKNTRQFQRFYVPKDYEVDEEMELLLKAQK